MKRYAVVTGFILIFSIHSFSEIADTSKAVLKCKSHNEIGVSIGGMNTIQKANNGYNGYLSVGYKHKFQSYSLRLNAYLYGKNHDDQVYYDGNSNDTAFVSTLIQYNNKHQGVRLGIEWDRVLYDDLLFYYGAEVGFEYYKEVSTRFTEYSNKVNMYHTSTGNSHHDIRYGNKIGIVPVLGLTQYCAKFASITLECFCPIMYNNIGKTQTVDLDVNLKLGLNVNF